MQLTRTITPSNNIWLEGCCILKWRRPYILFATTILLGSHIHRPSHLHELSANRVLHWHARSTLTGIKLTPCGDRQLLVFSDPDWGRMNGSNRYNGSAIMIDYGTEIMYTDSAVQRAAFFSHTETKYTTFSESCKLVTGLHQTLTELNEHHRKTEINQKHDGSTRWVNSGNANHYSSWKNIDIRQK